ncbi:hypothetical protein E4T44_01189 [Aureobasidium sp. EXF-8845]|nr:hypothetical protein E4T44_01189 [Aureobasidium sp. EXF-8845]KAI4857362.1 hypothetical protein E4T45_01147 [Aureobasidium sp. EXF-8846]
MVSRLALIVVDVQDGIANLTNGVPDADKVVTAVDSILCLTRQYNEIQTRSLESKRSRFYLYSMTTKIRKTPCIEESRLGNLCSSLNNLPRMRNWSLKIKTETCLGNMFESNPDLATSLRSQGIERLVFVGLQTDYRVRASILGAIASGFDASNITLLRGAHPTYDNSSTGKSYQDVKEDVEKQLADLGVALQDWNKLAL